MATNYPGALDSLTNPTVSSYEDDAGVLHDEQHANANDAIEAIEGELGTDPAGAFPTVAARVSGSPVLAAYGDARSLLVGPDHMATVDVGSSYGVASQAVIYQRWHCPESFTATKLWWVQTSLASGVTGAQIGLYSAAGSRLQTATVTSAVTSEGFKSATITGQAVVAGTVYYLAFLSDASTPGNVGAHFFNGIVVGATGASSSDRVNFTQSGQATLPASVTFSGLPQVNYVFAFGISAA